MTESALRLIDPWFFAGFGLSLCVIITHVIAGRALSASVEIRYNCPRYHHHGTLAEWLRSGLQNRVHRFNSGRCLHFFDFQCYNIF